MALISPCERIRLRELVQGGQDAADERDWRRLLSGESTPSVRACAEWSPGVYFHPYSLVVRMPEPDALVLERLPPILSRALRAPKRWAKAIHNATPFRS